MSVCDIQGRIVLVTWRWSSLARASFTEVRTDARNGEDPSSPGGNSRRPITKSDTTMRGMVSWKEGCRMRCGRHE